MIIYSGDLFDCIDSECRAICITTNGYIKANGKAAVGAGVAKAMDEMTEGMFAIQLASNLKLNGNITQTLFHDEESDTWVIALPTKPTSISFNNDYDVVRHMRGKYQYGDLVFGCFAMSTMEIIERSLKELVEIVDIMKWSQVALTPMGCGNGGLMFEEQVQPLMEKYLDDRFVCCVK